MMEHTKGMIYIAGIGPGSKEGMTEAAREALENSDLIIGYTTYIELIREYFPDKMFETTPMRREEERCRMVLEEAEKGKNVCLVSSGDAGVYGMAGLVLQMSVEYPALAGRIQIIPGVTAALSGAALLGSPLTNDFCTISLSDLLTPKEEIERRLKGAALGDFAIVLYNPSSRRRRDYLKRACDILLSCGLPESRPCGIVRSIGREGQEAQIVRLGELAGLEVDMFTTVFIGNSHTRIIGDRLVTPRGYRLTENKG